MTLACALPPLDQRYARVVAVNAQGIDLVAFSRGRPSGGAVLSALPGTVHRLGTFLAYGYRNAVAVESEGTFVCYSGLRFEGRPEDGASVASGQRIGEIEVPGRIDFLRSRDRTAGADPTYAYLHVEVWDRLPPLFVSAATVRGTTFRLERGAIAPQAFWPSLGIDFVGAPRSQVMAVRLGGPSDCGRRA